MITFQVVEVLAVGNRRAVAGRVVAGDVTRGTRFHSLSKDYLLLNKSCPVRRIDLTVTQLSAYGDDDRDCLPEGITGGLILEGDGWNSIGNPTIDSMVYLIADTLIATAS
ncbi:hypothetical protein Pla108_11800 [Botrimarina colliarenosi]|uniref:Uncharacterized protein n=1 Tax=Botrimarina colliarenosi TaxID=2528001 RepID=A0A5C6AJP1_9BACT|nr:hypothetical protein [Botrimarina colliarenosi]TWU00233.1 hypothetical protein Pla108_11800 [Botrimarina colliarenosi]